MGSIAIIVLTLLMLFSSVNFIYLAAGKTPEEAIDLKEKGLLNLIHSLFNISKNIERK